MWHVVQAFGTPLAVVIDGGMNLKVWARTFTSASSVAILGMWQEMHSFPALPAW